MDRLFDIAPGEVETLGIGPSTFVSMSNLPKDVGKQFDTIDEEIRRSNFTSAEKYNDKLVGHIKKEFEVPKHLQANNIKSFLVWLAGCTVSNDPSLKTLFDGIEYVPVSELLNLDNMWINYMQKHEFNPVHNHTGLLSWVVWNKIPFNVEDEMKVFPDTINNVTSTFSFVYDAPVKHMSIPVDKYMQNYICMFPSHLHHCVYPFYTSDDYRVSFSGNIFLKNNK